MGQKSLLSIIITSYNHAQYLPEAVKSAQTQTLKPTEIIVVDDGSTDDTRFLIKNFNEVKYIYQENQGLAAARNTGWKNCSGDYIIFLDADDILLPDAIEKGLSNFKEYPYSAFVSGHFRYIKEDGSFLSQFEQNYIERDHYKAFLRGNYIGMHAAVMYQRFCLEAVNGFDVKLKACEDYDLYLRISSLYPVSSHQNIIAEYRIHDKNMSADIEMMLKTVLQVLHSQKKNLHEESLNKAYKMGLKNWTSYYGVKLFSQIFKFILKGEIRKSFSCFSSIIKYSLNYFLNFIPSNK